MAKYPNFTITPSLEARFWSKVDKCGPEECWHWLAHSKHGYGRLKVMDYSMQATHVSLALDGRPRIDGLFALHSCDNPPCVNPRHLRWGSDADNIADRETRGRGVVVVSLGSTNGKSKLTEDDVRVIRQCGESALELAVRFGVHRSHIYKLRNGGQWIGI